MEGWLHRKLSKPNWMCIRFKCFLDRGAGRPMLSSHVYFKHSPNNHNSNYEQNNANNYGNSGSSVRYPRSTITNDTRRTLLAFVPNHKMQTVTSSEVFSRSD